MRVEHGVELPEMERGVPALYVEQDRECDRATGRDDGRVGMGEICASAIDPDPPGRADPGCVGNDALGSREQLFAARVLVRIPGEVAGSPGGGEQLERMKDVDGEVSQRAAARRGRLQQGFDGEWADSGEPGIEDGERVAGKSEGFEGRSGRHAEGGGQLGDMQDRLDDAVDRD